MSRIKKKPLLPWETATITGEDKHYIRLGDSFFDHPAVIGLSNPTFRVLLLMLRSCAGKREFDFTRNYYEKKFNLANRTVIRAVAELEQKGFLTVLRSYSRKTPNKYVWCDDWKKKR